MRGCGRLFQRRPPHRPYHHGGVHLRLGGPAGHRVHRAVDRAAARAEGRGPVRRAAPVRPFRNVRSGGLRRAPQGRAGHGEGPENPEGSQPRSGGELALHASHLYVGRPCAARAPCGRVARARAARRRDGRPPSRRSRRPRRRRTKVGPRLRRNRSSRRRQPRAPA